VVALRTLFSVRRAGVHHVISALFALNSYEFVASSNEIRALGPLVGEKIVLHIVF
jgi:hypothetical protein